MVVAISNTVDHVGSVNTCMMHDQACKVELFYSKAYKYWHTNVCTGKMLLSILHSQETVNIFCISKYRIVLPLTHICFDQFIPNRICLLQYLSSFRNVMLKWVEHTIMTIDATWYSLHFHEIIFVPNKIRRISMSYLS